MNNNNNGHTIVYTMVTQLFSNFSTKFDNRMTMYDNCMTMYDNNKYSIINIQ